MSKYRIKQRTTGEHSFFFIQKKGLLFWNSFSHYTVPFIHTTYGGAKKALDDYLKRLEAGEFNTHTTFHVYK